jgi:integrase/recombinase XerD
MSKRVLAELARHQSIATTQRYIDINDDMLRNAVENVKTELSFKHLYIQL